MRRIRHLPCIICGFILVLYMYYMNFEHVHVTKYEVSDVHYFALPEVNYSDSAFIVDTPVCKIPNVDPFDKSVKHLLRNGSPLTCKTTLDLVFVKGKTIYINWKAINESQHINKIQYCKYVVIWRPYNEKKDHDFVEFKNESSKTFTSHIDVSDEFIRVKCYTAKDNDVYTNFFSFVHLKPDVEKRCTENHKKYDHKRKENLSVLMLGVDSISRINMMRYMKETRSYLLNKLSAIELFGYNKIADNTFFNIVPMTTGKYVDNLPWNESIRWTMDNSNFIWNNYSANGYRTLYVEDYPDIAIFDFGKSGFEKPPGDYFNRHFTLAMENSKDIWNTHHYCVHGRKESDIHLDYVHQFMEQFKADPYFAFAFITRLTHAYLEETYKADKIYADFFHSLNEKGSLENTVVIFFSDHGMRFGSIRETFVGKLEERLPYMFIVFPQWFLRKYPEIHNNLKINSRRLTTAFDIYETLSGILNFKGSNQGTPTKGRAMSLLNEIPKSRTCEDADILPHWCTCSQHEQLIITNTTVIQVGETLVTKINEFLEKDFNVCEKLSLKAIKYALRVIPSDKVLRFVESKNDVIDRIVRYGERVNSYVDYQVTLQTQPGDGVFEGTLRYDEENKTFDLVGDVSRINKYGTQSHCIDSHHLKKLCYCKIQK